MHPGLLGTGRAPTCLRHNLPPLFQFSHELGAFPIQASCWALEGTGAAHRLLSNHPRIPSERGKDLFDFLLSIPEEHLGVVREEEWVLY